MGNLVIAVVLGVVAAVFWYWVGYIVVVAVAGLLS